MLSVDLSDAQILTIPGEALPNNGFCLKRTREMYLQKGKLSKSTLFIIYPKGVVGEPEEEMWPRGGSSCRSRRGVGAI